MSEFDTTISHGGGEAHVEHTADDTSHQFKLPGARSLLEHVHIPQDERNNSPIYTATFERPYSEIIQADYTHDPYIGLDATDRDWKSERCPPGMPMVLAKARGLPLDRPPENPQTNTSTGIPTGPRSPAPGYMRRENYQIVPSRQGSGLPIITLGQISTTQHTDSQLQGDHHQGLPSRQQK